MSNEVSQILDGIKTRLQAVLGSEYTELGFIIDVSKNPFKGATKRYGILAGDIVEVEDSGVTGAYTVEQDFKIKLTNKHATSQAGDSSRRSTMVDLLEKSLLIYKDLVTTRVGVPTLVLRVLDGMATESNYLDEVCESTMTIRVLYRINL